MQSGDVFYLPELIMLTEEEKQIILNTYKWIKVPRYVDDESLSWEERYKRLDEHHVRETSFLIEKIRALVAGM
ncbi:hypothetical protein BC343_22695 [Mucilaginibacter pedocola]|uniref:Uncharacterized protein n=2 Tax=Mucilaginibacter pedocola TaxID=1792845 RepID=A0A1S9PJL6_9SPHI|nr:hypothetical protein BC343_22695 [Mucilaginibacter pedocola]